jgi:hypothetical protein
LFAFSNSNIFFVFSSLFLLCTNNSLITINCHCYIFVITSSSHKIILCPSFLSLGVVNIIVELLQCFP